MTDITLGRWGHVPANFRMARGQEPRTPQHMWFRNIVYQLDSVVCQVAVLRKLEASTIISSYSPLSEQETTLYAVCQCVHVCCEGHAPADEINMQCCLCTVEINAAPALPGGPPKPICCHQGHLCWICYRRCPDGGWKNSFLFFQDLTGWPGIWYGNMRQVICRRENGKYKTISIQQQNNAVW